MSAPQCEICSTRKDVVERRNGAKICGPCQESFKRTYRAMNRITKAIRKVQHPKPHASLQDKINELDERVIDWDCGSR